MYKTDNEPIRLSYHCGVHYNSIIDPWRPTAGHGLGFPDLEPGVNNYAKRIFFYMLPIYFSVLNNHLYEQHYVNPKKVILNELCLMTK